MQNTVRRAKITVSRPTGAGLVSQAGLLLLAETARVTGLGEVHVPVLLARWRAPRAVHDPGKILTDLAMTLALGGDCLADAAVLRARPERTRAVASDPVISLLVARAGCGCPAGAAGDPARPRQAARERAWDAGRGHRARRGRVVLIPGRHRRDDRARAQREGKSLLLPGRRPLAC